jgi:uncharacterized membrane protein
MENKDDGDQAVFNTILSRNIETLLIRRKEEEKRKSRTDKIADTITKFTGSMAFVYIHLFIFGLWILINLGWIPLPKFDPQFIILAMAASVEAIFLSTFVLISQNRMAEISNKRADLDLQISLLSEHEVTSLITLVSEIAKKMGIDITKNPELEHLDKDVKPEKVLDTIEDTEKKILENKIYDDKK